MGSACVSTIKPALLGLYSNNSYCVLGQVRSGHSNVRLRLSSLVILAYGVVFVLVSWGEGTHGSFLSPQADLGLYPPSTW